MGAVLPMGRFGQPDDIARVAVFLASDRSAWLTGERITASGGQRYTASAAVASSRQPPFISLIRPPLPNYPFAPSPRDPRCGVAAPSGGAWSSINAFVAARARASISFGPGCSATPSSRLIIKVPHSNPAN